MNCEFQTRAREVVGRRFAELHIADDQENESAEKNNAREEVVPPPDTCTCGCCEITPLTDFDERYIEDIPPVSREVLRRIHLHGRCGNCGMTVRHPDVLASPPVTIGPNTGTSPTRVDPRRLTPSKLA